MVALCRLPTSSISTSASQIVPALSQMSSRPSNTNYPRGHLSPIIPWSRYHFRFYSRWTDIDHLVAILHGNLNIQGILLVSHLLSRTVLGSWRSVYRRTRSWGKYRWPFGKQEELKQEELLAGTGIHKTPSTTSAKACPFAFDHVMMQVCESQLVVVGVLWNTWPCCQSS